jgi:hypothetical protein
VNTGIWLFGGLAGMAVALLFHTARTLDALAKEVGTLRAELSAALFEGYPSPGKAHLRLMKDQLDALAYDVEAMNDRQTAGPVRPSEPP